MSFKSQLQAFEAELDADLARRKIFRMDPRSTIMGSLSILATAYSQIETLHVGWRLERGFDIALPLLARGTGTDDFDPEVAIKDLTYMSDYYMIREYLYYSYNVPDAFEWSYSDEEVRISFKDASIPRQFAQYGNSHWLESIQMTKEDEPYGESLVPILSGTEELGTGEHLQQAYEICNNEARRKISKDFSVLEGKVETVQFNGYTYKDFTTFYEYLLTKAIYHRHYARINDTWAVFEFPAEALHSEISHNAQLSLDVVVAILKDITYETSGTTKLSPMYYSVFKDDLADQYLIIPQRLIQADGLVQFLRIQAVKDPDLFSRSLSGPLGDGLVTRVASAFERLGFYVKTNVDLSDVDSEAPDIDVLAISREPTLGYVFFLCEVKATIPAIWAKDHLRVLRPDSLPKAFDQVETTRRALKSEAGINKIHSLISDFDPDLMDGFVVPIKNVIVTSHNAGMFFSDKAEDTPVVDYKTLLHILGASDSDTAYILYYLNELSSMFGRPETAFLECRVGDRSVKYEVVPIKRFLSFAANTWKSDGSDVKFAESFYAEGHGRLDVLRDYEEDSRPET